MRFIGDVHGKFDQYVAITQECAQSIQVGDFGLGFRPMPDVSMQHRFIRGNHDNPELCRQTSNWIADGSFFDDMFFVGGGESIDRYNRTEGVDWWADEQLSSGDLYAIMDRYEEAKPSVLITHECPSSIAPRLFNHVPYRELNPSRTSQALDSMLYIHKPELYIFGHWHKNVDVTIEGTRFICLAELAYIDL